MLIILYSIGLLNLIQSGFSERLNCNNNDKLCNEPFKLNKSNCRCECLIECSNSETIDDKHCVCLKHHHHHSPQILIPSNVETKSIKCDEGKHLDSKTQLCVCTESADCEEKSFQLSIDRCNCECREQTCPLGFIFDKLICDCVKEMKPSPSCPDDYIFDDSHGRCVCVQNTACSGGFQWDVSGETCQCTCFEKIECKLSQIWDISQCQCVCNLPSTTDCPPHKRFDIEACGCVCTERSCEFGKVFDPPTCSCVKGFLPECPENFLWNSIESKCVCANNSNFCKNSNNIWDDLQCKCLETGKSLS